LYQHLKKLAYGLYSDSIAHFAIVFSALIQDVDHRGCLNTRLALEELTMATQYRNKSIAEQNSLDLSWGLLMTDQFAKLQRAIFCRNEDLLHFQHIFVNVVLATDIFDKELNDLRRSCWNVAFADTSSVTRINDEYDMDCKLFKPPMWPIQCNIGKYIVNGICVYFRKCPGFIGMIEWLLIQSLFGIKGN
jgi:3'5'-cyclic nucleotide phosphodiesterase